MEYHTPVMSAEVVDGLVTSSQGIYVDTTAGGGGHCREILRCLDSRGRLIAIDRDVEAVAELALLAREFPDQVTVVQGRFGILGELLASEDSITGILFDLGVSSHQIDAGRRGFSYQQVGPLDMRMDRGAGVPAAALLAQISEADLADIISRFGEERHSRRVARAVIRQRDAGRMESTADLRAAVASTGPQMLNKTLARVFQALRIVVNDELVELDHALDAAVDLLAADGRLVIIAYHSLEDRLVKNKMAQLISGCVCPPRLPVCACGGKPQLASVKPRQRAAHSEVEANPRARSAGLRSYRKL